MDFMVGVLSGGQLLYYRMVSRPTSNTAISPQSVFPFLLAWALVIVFAVIAVKEIRPPAPLPANAPENEFSSQRAIVHVREIARVPHPLGTDANTTVKKDVILMLAFQTGQVELPEIAHQCQPVRTVMLKR